MWVPGAPEAGGLRQHAWGPEGDKLPHRYSWMNGASWLRGETPETLAEGLAEWRWTAEVSPDGDVTGLEFEGENLGDDIWLWRALAPFVESGSYLEMMGEDGERWRWVFVNGGFAEISPEPLTWPEEGT